MLTLQAKRRSIFWFTFLALAVAAPLLLSSSGARANESQILLDGELQLDAVPAPVSAPAHAPTSAKDRPQFPGHWSVTPEDIHIRTESIFKFFGVESEKSFQTEIDGLPVRAAPSDFKSWLRVLDPKAQFARFFTLTPFKVFGFSDRDGKIDQELSANLLAHSDRVLSTSFAQTPLSGLRIALDPGHMGTTAWDHATGKWVHDRSGKIVSEGLINLQVSLLLKKELEELGATVMITRSSLAPVSELTPRQIDLQHYARQELRLQSLQPWFINLISSGRTTADVLASFQKSAKVRSLFSENMRMTYFILREDLQARAQKIAAFQPDLTLVIHFDAADSPGHDPQLLNRPVADRTRAYVPGAYGAADFSTAETRGHLLEHLLQPQEMAKSVEVSSAIVRAISTELSVPTEPTDGAETVTISPGVFARNLELTRMVTKGAISYVECLMYGSGREFDLLTQNDFSMLIDGQSYGYSKRLLSLTGAIRDGVVASMVGPRP